MEIIVNGRPAIVAERVTLARALPAFGFKPGKAAVAVNEAFVPREQHANVNLAPGDRIDIVTRIEGG